MFFVLKMLQNSRIKQEAEQKVDKRNALNNEIKKEELWLDDDDDLINKCRACLEIGKIPIHGKDSNIAESIKLISGVQVEENDELPKFLCRPCYSLLRGAIQFRKLIKESDHLVKQLKYEPPNYTDISDNNSFNFEINEQKPSVSTTTLLPSEESYDNQVNIKSYDKQLNIKPYDKQLNIKSYDNQLNINSYDNQLNIKSYDSPEPLDNYDNNDDSDAELMEDDKPKVKVECKVCKKQVTKYYYKDHLALQHGLGIGTRKEKAKIECKHCHKTLLVAYYKKHLSTVHGNEPSQYICYVCGKAFKYQSGYNSHVTTHTNDFPFKCEICPYRGRHSGLLKTHMRTHTRDYRFQCTVCPARFLTSGNLNKHLLKHKERKHKCDSCSRAFHSQSEVEKHYQVDHLGIKNHVCNICEKAFGYRSAMMKHQLHVHKRQKMLNGRTPSYLEVERSEQGNVPEMCTEGFGQ